MNETIEKHFEQLSNEANTFLLNSPMFKYFGVLNLWLEKKLKPWNPNNQHPEWTIGGCTNGKSIIYQVRDEHSSLQEFIYVTLHELLHVILSHVGRSNNRDKTIWNSAIDHVVNKILLDLSKRSSKFYVSKHDIFYPEIAQQYPNATAEEVYEMLIQKQPPNNSGSDGEQHSETNESQTDSGTDSEGDTFSAPSDIFGTGDKKLYGFQDQDGRGNSVSTSSESDTSDPSTNETDAKTIKKFSKDLANKAKALWHSNEIRKGDIPESIVRALDDIFSIEIPWSDILKQALLFNCQSRVKRSWAEPNLILRRPKYRSPGKILKGKSAKTLIISCDTSGSITKSDLETFAGVVFSSRKFYDSLIVLVHSVEITNILQYKKFPKEEELSKTLKENLKGGGGTSHRFVFDKIEELDKTLKLSSVVFLTDYYSDVERIYKKYNWIRKHNSVWVLNSNKDVELEDCRSSVIHLDNYL